MKRMLEPCQKGSVVTQGEEVSKQQVVNLGIRVNSLALPEGGERKRNLTTTGLGEKPQK